MSDEIQETQETADNRRAETRSRKMTFYENAYEWGDFHIPLRMMGGLERYIKDRIQPGDFLTAVICNDLSQAVGRADNENLHNIPAYLAFFHNEVPLACWGSHQKMVDWLEEQGVEK